MDMVDSGKTASLSRRKILAGGMIVAANLSGVGRLRAQVPAGSADFKEYDVMTNGITLHVTEQG